jgi:tetratricopeptide (TPR) repeat protein
VAAEKLADPGRAQSLALEAELADPADPALRSTLRAIYRASGLWAELLGELRRAAETASSLDEAIALRVEAATVAATELSDPAAAEAELRAILDRSPGHPAAAAGLARLYEASGRRHEARALLEDSAARLGSVPRALQILTELADLCELRLGDPGGAIIALTNALHIASRDLGLIRRLGALLEKAERWKELADVSELEARSAESAPDRVAAWLRVAELAQRRTAEPARVVRALEEARNLAPDDVEVSNRLLEAVLEAGRLEDASAMLDGLIAAREKQGRRADLYRLQFLRGRVASERGDLGTARRAWQASFSLNASYVPNIISLGKLHMQLGESEDALRVFQTALLHQHAIDSDATKVDVFYHLGLLRKRGGDLRRAKDMFSRALSIDPQHGPSQEALREIG